MPDFVILSEAKNLSSCLFAFDFAAVVAESTRHTNGDSSSPGGNDALPGAVLIRTPRKLGNGSSKELKMDASLRSA
jgi:putative NIF3 family GTP cyclohydrolase 1 type 2